MSAYVVNRDHIWFLVQCACHYGASFREGEAGWVRVDQSASRDLLLRVGTMLWEENIKSVLARYADNTRADMPGPIGETFNLEDAPRAEWGVINPLQAIKSAFCYQYQSCEHDSWEESNAKRITDQIVHGAISELPGYDAAQWGPPKQEPYRSAI